MSGRVPDAAEMRRRIGDARARVNATHGVAIGLLMLDQPARAEHVDRVLALLDPAVIARRGEELSAARLRRAASFAEALVDRIEAG